jgi:hypothetical protein
MQAEYGAKVSTKWPIRTVNLSPRAPVGWTRQAMRAYSVRVILVQAIAKTPEFDIQA